MSFSACPLNVSCDIYGRYEWESNSDVAGLGVLIGFVGTAYIAFALILINYFVAYDPEIPPPQKKRSIERQIRSTARRVLTGTETFTNMPVNPTYWIPNPIDVKLLAWLRLRTTKVLEKCRIALPDFVTARPEQFRVGFNKSILNMCDAQILTGISILTSGFISLDNSLSSLHWKMIVYLAWFSCVTHLSGLTVLRRHLQGESWARYTRLTLMLVLLIMLIVAMIPTAFFNWEEGEKTAYISAANLDTPAICFFSIDCGKALYYSKEPEVPLSQTPAFIEMLISQTFISFGFIARSIKLSTRLSDRLHRNIRAPLAKFSHRQLQRLEVLLYSRGHTSTRTNASSDLESLRYGLIIRPILALVIMFRTQAELFNSMLGEIFWLWVILLWGTSKLAIASYNEWEFSSTKDHVSPSDQWEFGQVLPVLLLVAPLITLLGPFVSEPAHPDCQIQGMEQTQVSDHNALPAPEPGQVQRAEGRPNSMAIPLLARGASHEAGQRGADDHGDHVNTDRAFERGRIGLSSAVSGEYYSNMEWMLPYLASSFVIIAVHIFFLFRYATDTFYSLYLYLEIPEPEWVYPYWNPSDYMFTQGGVFYLVILTYPSAGQAIILLGVTVHDWWQRPHGTFDYYRRSVVFWIMAIVVHGLYACIIYLEAIPLYWKFVSVILVTLGLYVVYAVTCWITCCRSSNRRERRARVTLM